MFTDGIARIEQFGAKCDRTTSAVSAFNACQSYAASAGLSVSSAKSTGGFLIDGTVYVRVETDIKSALVFPADGISRYVDIVRPSSGYEPDILDINSLSGLDEFSDKIAGLPSDAAGRYIWIESTEVLTERMQNGVAATPYYKNSAALIMSEDGHIVPSLDASISTGVVTLHKQIPAMDVRIARVECDDVSGDQRGAIRILRDNVSLDVGSVKSAGAQWRTLISVGANGAKVTAPAINEIDYDGFGYGVSIGLSCNTNISGLTGGAPRHTISGRHGALVTLRDCTLETMDTHWGNSYVLDNCNVYKLLWAGKDLTVNGGALLGNYAVTVRSDTVMATGTLRLNNVSLGENTISLVRTSNILIDPFTDPRKMFDVVDVRGVSVSYNGRFTGYDFGYSLASLATVEMPRSIYLNLISDTPREIEALRITLDNVDALDAAPEYIIDGVNTHPDSSLIFCRGFAGGTSSAYGIKWKIRNCGAFDLWVDSDSIESMEVTNCDVQSIGRVNSKSARGRIRLNGGTLSAGGIANPNASLVDAFNVVVLTDIPDITFSSRTGCLALDTVVTDVSDYKDPTIYA